MSENKYDLIVIGAGPAGFAAAQAAGKLGKKVLCVEKHKVGGTCLNKGCVPTKALVAAAHTCSEIKSAEKFSLDAKLLGFDFEKLKGRVSELLDLIGKGAAFSLKKSGVEVLFGEVKICVGGKVEVFCAGTKKEFFADKILIASGAKARLPHGVNLSENVLDASAALELGFIPKSAIIIGAGAIGCEFAHIWNAFGAHVDLVEMRENILPNEDEDASKTLARNFAKRGIVLHTSCMAKEIVNKEKTACVKLATPKGDLDLNAQIVLVGAGVEADLKSLFETTLPDLDERGFVKVDEVFKTSIDNIYACGDIVGAPWLAHAASAQAMVMIDNIFGGKSKIYDIKNVPSAAYCGLEVASVGVNLKEAKAKNLDCKVAKLPLGVSAKAIVEGKAEGFVRLIADEKSVLIGAQIVSQNAGEFINICSLAIANKLKVSDFLKSIFTHPSVSEALYEAALDLERQYLSK